MCLRQKNDNGTSKSHFDLWHCTKNLKIILNGDDLSATTLFPLICSPTTSDESRGSDSATPMSSIPQPNSPSNRKRKFKCDESLVVKLSSCQVVIWNQCCNTSVHDNNQSL